MSTRAAAEHKDLLPRRIHSQKIPIIPAGRRTDAGPTVWPVRPRSSALSVHDKKTNLLHRGRRGVKKKTAENERKNPDRGTPTSTLAGRTGLSLFLYSLPDTSPLLPRRPARSHPPYSRVETRGRCETSRSPLGSRTEPSRGREGWWRRRRRRGVGPSLRWTRVQPNGRAGASDASFAAEWEPRAEGSQSDPEVPLPFTCSNSHHSVAPVTSTESPSNHGPQTRMCIQEEEKHGEDAVTMATQLFFLPRGQI